MADGFNSAFKGQASFLTGCEIPILEVDSSHAEVHVQLWIWTDVQIKLKAEYKLFIQGRNNSTAQMVHEKKLN